MKTDVVYKRRRLNTLIPRVTDKMVKYMQPKKKKRGGGEIHQKV